MAEQVAVLERREKVRLDTDRLVALVRELGAVEAEDMVSRSMEELAVRLSFTERQFRHGKRIEMRKSARALVGIADQIGMNAVARVAGDVIACADRGDETALAAVLARLMRIGEGSLTAIWDLHDQPV
ncbi:hypothetical protein ATO6_02500 [Oceanicola sp. 22II-s10i]|uniref:hypothetical protein n=1 Tax=Oceanicola sp. 22II-s10i TaxID=1317116 RepID=UPI000B5221BA|nr:hypothetical protein [Oceanicola sp. 22II-s10i]OWU85799.1 hypothetical protein ATO6_02500 [Oceanicola sp. 22II-s10i]